jgi:hypothetical protein
LPDRNTNTLIPQDKVNDERFSKGTPNLAIGEHMITFKMGFSIYFLDLVQSA